MKSASMTNTSQDSAQQDQSSLASPNMQAYEQHPTSVGGNSNGAPQAQGQTQMITTKTGKILDPQQMHVCRLCDKLLSSSSSLDRHMLTHSGERPFVCKRCHMTFTTNGNMHRHMRTHLHKDSLARQQQEQMQLKQSLLAGGSSAGSMASAGVGLNSTTSQQQVAGPGSFGVTGQRDIFSPIVVGSSPVAPAASHFQPHSHANHQQSPGNPLMSAPHMSGSHMAANQHQQQQAAPLVGPLASLLGATTANQSGNHHMQALLNQHLVAAMVQQQQQQQLQLNLRNGSNKLELNNLGIQSGRQDQQVTGDISTQLFQNQQAALAAAASQLMQQQQQQQQCAPAGDLDTKSLMMSAALAAASQDPRVSLESVKAVMLAAAAAAAAATSGAASKTSNSTNNNNNLLMELPLDQLLQQRVTEPSRSEQRVVRGKRRKQIKPLRSHQQQQEEAVAGDCRSESGDKQQQPQQHDHSGASSLIEDLLAGCEARAEHEDRGRASIAKSARVAVKPESELSASPPRQQQREDFNNNSQPAARAHFTDCAISSLDHIIDDHYSRSPSSTTTPTVDRQNVKPCHLFGDSDEQTGGPSGVTKSERLEIDQESGTDIDDQEDQDRGQDSGDNHQRDLPSGSPRFGTGDKNNNDDQNKDKSYNMDQGDSTMRLSVKQREDEEHPQIISNNFNYTNNTTSDSFEDQDYSNTNTSSNSGDRRQSSSFVSSSREIADDGDDEEDEEDNDDDEEEGLMMFGAQTRGEPDEDRQQRHQHDDDEERGDSRSGITQLGPGDEDDEIIEDISQSYVKTANPNAMRKGGKRNRHCYKCKLCTYSSVDRCTLVRHLRIHSGERPYICGICRYAFTTKANCERHVRKRHKKQYNSLGGSGGVKGSNGGGRSLIITDHSNHQTIPVKVNPVAAQTISQTLRRIQEKEQQQQQLDVHDGLQPSLDLVGGHHRASMLNDDNIERIGQQGGLGSNNSNNNNNDIKSIRSSAKMSSLSTLNGKRKHKATLETDHDQDIQSYQRRRLAAGKHQLTTRGDQLPAPLGMLGGLMGLSNEQLPTGYDRASIQAAAANFLGAAATSVDKDTTATTSELFANLLSQIQQINNNNNHNGDEHIATTSTSSKQRTVTSDSPVSNATFLANMLAAGKAMATSSETPVVLPATFNSLISTKDLSHQFAQLRDLNQQSNFFNRRNPFDPFNSLELAAQALDLSCSQQPGHK